MVEKHFTDDVNRNGPDHKFSMDPKSWRDMVDRTRELELALGSEKKDVMENEEETVVLQRRAIRAQQRLTVGSVLTMDNLTYLRPCPTDALPPYRNDELIGRSVTREIEKGDCVRLGDVE